MAASLARGVVAHGHLDLLRGASETVAFVLGVRNHFLNKFAEHKVEFPGEAFFLGTVIHSLDHALAARNMADALWLDAAHPTFGPMAEYGRVVRCAFVEDLPLLSFPVKFRNVPHPFFRAIYAHAVKVNKALADELDVCIIR
jgi:hypothetical protein